MSRRSNSNKDLTAGMKGWERQYIKKSIKYGHLDDDVTVGSSKQQHKYSKGK